jgi:small subunit ribosomal protein S1
MSDQENTTLEQTEVQAEVQAETQTELQTEVLPEAHPDAQPESEPIEMQAEQQLNAEPEATAPLSGAKPDEPPMSEAAETPIEAPADAMASQAVAAAAPRVEEAASEQETARREAEEFDSLLDAYPQYTHPPLGTVLKGQVVKITGPEVIVDVGHKCEGVIPAEELLDSQGNLKVQPGDEIDCLMESTEERDGYVTLSYAKARKLRAWSDIEAAYQDQTPMTGVVIEKTKGGLAVDIGMRAFLPGSQIDIRPVRNLDALLGQEISCKVLKVNRKRGNIVVSRKVVLEEESKQRKEATLGQLQEGAVLTGTVKNLTEYGAFVDLGGIDGLLHITDLSWGRVGNPSEVVSVGQQIQVKVLKFDPEKERVSLGLKQLTEDPWLAVAEKYHAGDRVSGKVLNVTDYGAFVELEPGVEGLVHVSEMSWSKRLRHPSKIVSRGDHVQAVILEVNPKGRRISLGLKQTEPNPWTGLAERYPVGSVIEGKVRNLTDFGAFVEVEEGVDGLVHVSDLSWTERIKHPSQVLKKGERVQAVVLNIDPENRRLSLGIKQLQPDVWESFCNTHEVGTAVKGKIVRKTAFGLFVELVEGLEGLCHISEVSSDPGERKRMPLEIGEEHEFRIIKMNPEERKIGLSLKAMREEPPRPEKEKPIKAQPSSSGATTNIGELMAMKERNPNRN